MTYMYEGWTLYKKDVVNQCNDIETLYFFSKRTPISGKPSDLSEGFKVVVSERTGLPILKKESICR